MSVTQILKHAVHKAALPQQQIDPAYKKMRLQVFLGILDYVLVNKPIWYIALANGFIYLVHNGVLDWNPTYLKEAKGFSLSQRMAYFLYERAGIFGNIIMQIAKRKIFMMNRGWNGGFYVFLLPVSLLFYSLL